jgi:hypothetical protein
MNTCKKIEPLIEALGSSNEPSTDVAEQNPAEVVGSQHAEDLRSILRLCGPAFLARFVLHQASVCRQSEHDLATSLQRYRESLSVRDSKELESFGLGDIWSGLLWWKNDSSWIGQAGVLTRDDVQQRVIETLDGYLAQLANGASNEEIAHSVSEDTGASPLALRVMRELSCDHAAPGFQAVVSFIVCELGVTR